MVLDVLLLGLSGIVLVLTLWTSELSVVDQRLIARHFYGRWSVDLAHINKAEPGTFLGLWIWTDTGRRLRTLVSGRQWDEPWVTRAEKICLRIEELAESAGATIDQGND